MDYEMIKFISHVVTMIAFGIMVYLLARALPRINDADTRKIKTKNSRTSVYIEKIDLRLKKITEKLLRRSRISVLKIENKIDKKISDVKKETQTKTTILDNDETNF